MIKNKLESRVITPELFKSNFASMQNRLKAFMLRKYPYLANGNRVSGKDVSDYVSEGFEKLLQNFDFETFTYKDNSLTINEFQRLWLFACKQVLLNDNASAYKGKKDSKVKVSVSNIVTDMDGKEIVSNVIEGRLLEMDADNTKNPKIQSVRKVLLAKIENSNNEKDKLFFKRVFAYLHICSILRKRNYGSKIESITIKDIIDCYAGIFDSLGTFQMFKSRLLNDSRLSELKFAA